MCEAGTKWHKEGIKTSIGNDQKEEAVKCTNTRMTSMKTATIKHI